MSDVWAELQEWFAAQCNGEWENSHGVKIDTLNNPGWQVRIRIDGTPMEGFSLAPVQQVKSDADWVVVRCDGTTFEGFGGTRNLEELIRRFIDFTKSPPQPA